jgi:hypothetical protein
MVLEEEVDSIPTSSHLDYPIPQLMATINKEDIILLIQ